MVDIKPLSKNFEDEIKQAQTAEELQDAIRPEVVGQNELFQADSQPAAAVQIQSTQTAVNESRRTSAEKDLKRWDRESMAINFYSLLGVVVSIYLIVSTIRSDTSEDWKSYYCFWAGLNALVYLMLLKKSDFARRIIIFCACLSVIFIGMTKNVSITAYDVASIIVWLTLIIFLSSERIKNHF